MDFQTLVDTDAVGIKIEHDEAVMLSFDAHSIGVNKRLKIHCRSFA